MVSRSSFRHKAMHTQCASEFVRIDTKILIVGFGSVGPILKNKIVVPLGQGQCKKCICRIGGCGQCGCCDGGSGYPTEARQRCDEPAGENAALADGPAMLPASRQELVGYLSAFCILPCTPCIPQSWTAFNWQLIHKWAARKPNQYFK